METKTQKLLGSIEREPMKYATACKLVGNDQLSKLIAAGAVEKYQGENQDYASGLPGQKPMCFFVRAGKIPYQAHSRYREATDEGIAKAIKFLERHGYTVLPPNDLAKPPVAALCDRSA